jgi:hypothetical protein
MTVSRELSRYRLDLVEVQEVRWEDSSTVPAGEYRVFLYIRESYQQLRGLSLLMIGCHA